MSSKKVKYLLPAKSIDMGGFPIKQALPTQKVSQIDPFLLLHHGRAKFSNNRPARQQGIGPHPHRGFSPVTFVIDGEVHHRDSRGNSQIAKKGEVQWMHAGAGIIHSERPSQDLAERKGRQEIVQIWVNSPAKSKMKIPKYTHLGIKDMPIITSQDGKVSMKIVAGNYKNEDGKITTESPLLILWGNAKSGSVENLQIPEGFNSSIYVVKGQIKIEKYGIVDAENLVLFENEANEIQLTFDMDTDFILLSGEPINEEISQSGPYVMNTQTELMIAMRDYQMGKMGILIEDEMG